jgi:hypothetical protein
MKLICVAFGVAALYATGAAAQTREVQEHGKQKVEVTDGKKTTVTGCLERNPDGGYMITNETGGLKYELVTGKDLSDHVGQLVAVRGKATDRGDAKVKIESKVGTSGTTGDERDASKSNRKTELKGDLGLKYLGVDSVKMISKSCR